MLKVHSDIDNCTMLKLWGKVAKNCVFVLSVFIPLICKLYWVYAVMYIENQIE